jgi:hypothetical protein
MTNERSKVSRTQKVCFWCKYLDHSGPDCKRHAPHPIVIGLLKDEEAGETTVWWPVVDPAHDWCAEFEEGSAFDLTERQPQDRDLDDLKEMGWEPREPG